MLQVVCAYAKIIDEFQSIDIFYAIVESQRKHQGAVNKLFSKQQILDGIKISYSTYAYTLVGVTAKCKETSN